MKLLRRREVSALELRTVVLSAIEALNPQLNFLSSRTDISDTQTRFHSEADFTGLPMLVKEGVGLRGQPAIMGSRLGAELRSPHDGELVRRLRRAGVTFLGSTTAPEFGNSPTTESVLHGPTRNPWNTAHSTGGSSGGASAAVAAGVVPVAQSSDGGGSIRTPAHCCGVVGLKPSRGRTPNGPDGYGGLFGLGVAHVTTRSVRDTAAFLDVLQGDDAGALYRIGAPSRPFLAEVGANPGRLRIAYSTVSPSGHATHPDCAQATLDTAKRCNELGHAVEEAAPSYDWEAFRHAFCDLWATHLPYAVSLLEAATGKAATPETLETANWVTLQHGRGLSMESLARSAACLHQLARAVEHFFRTYDVFISPVDLTPAPLLGAVDANGAHRTVYDWFDAAISRFAAFVPVFNVTGQPALSLPLSMSAEGLPVGVHFAARVGDEATLLRLGAQLELACPWGGRRPPVHVARLDT